MSCDGILSFNVPAKIIKVLKHLKKYSNILGVPPSRTLDNIQEDGITSEGNILLKLNKDCIYSPNPFFFSLLGYKMPQPSGENGRACREFLRKVR